MHKGVNLVKDCCLYTEIVFDSKGKSFFIYFFMQQLSVGTWDKGSSLSRYKHQNGFITAERTFEDCGSADRPLVAGSSHKHYMLYTIWQIYTICSLVT